MIRELFVTIYQVDETIARLISLQIEQCTRWQVTHHLTHETFFVIVGRLFEYVCELFVILVRVDVQQGQVESTQPNLVRNGPLINQSKKKNLLKLTVNFTIIIIMFNFS